MVEFLFWRKGRLITQNHTEERQARNVLTENDERQSDRSRENEPDRSPNGGPEASGQYHGNRGKAGALPKDQIRDLLQKHIA